MSKSPRSILKRSLFFATGSARAGGTTAGAPLEAERDELTAKLDRVAARLANARQHAAAALATRNHLYAERGADETAVSLAVRAVHEANGTVDGLEDLLTEIEEGIAALGARIVERDAQAERERQAAEQLVRAEELAEAGRNLHAASDALAEAYERFRRAAYRARPVTSANPVGPETLIGETRSLILAHAFPVNFSHPPISSATTALQAIDAVVETMRNEVRSGNVVALRPTPPPPPLVEPTFPEVVIAISSPGAFYRSAFGVRVDLGPGGWTIPDPIARAAIEAGVGFGAETPEGKSIIRSAHQSPGAPIERGAGGTFQPKRFTGLLGDTGKGLKPSVPPIDLGRLPFTGEIPLAEAAQ